jgi:hypothetical protein
MSSVSVSHPFVSSRVFLSHHVFLSPHVTIKCATVFASEKCYESMTHDSGSSVRSPWRREVGWLRWVPTSTIWRWLGGWLGGTPTPPLSLTHFSACALHERCARSAPGLFPARRLVSCAFSCRLHWRSVSSSSMTLSSSLRTPAIVSKSTCHRSFLAVSCPFNASLLRCDRVSLFMFHLIAVIPRRFFLRNGCRSRASLRQHWRRTRSLW